MTAVPHSFLFRFSVPISRGTAKGGTLPAKYRLPDLKQIDDVPSAVEVRLAWSEDALTLNLLVPLEECSSEDGSPREFRVWFDTRDAKSIHRANRFCSELLITLPSDDSPPTVSAEEIRRAKETPVEVDVSKIKVKRDATTKHERLLLAIPADCVPGFDREVSSRIGFFYTWQDADGTVTTPTVGTDFPYHTDPSLWLTLELLPD